MCLGFLSRLAAVQTCRKLHLLQDIFPSGFNSPLPSSPRHSPGLDRQRETPPPVTTLLPCTHPCHKNGCGSKRGLN